MVVSLAPEMAVKLRYSRRMEKEFQISIDDYIYSQTMLRSLKCMMHYMSKTNEVEDYPGWYEEGGSRYYKCPVHWTWETHDENRKKKIIQDFEWYRLGHKEDGLLCALCPDVLYLTAHNVHMVHGAMLFRIPEFMNADAEQIAIHSQLNTSTWQRQLHTLAVNSEKLFRIAEKLRSFRARKIQRFFRHVVLKRKNGGHRPIG